MELVNGINFHWELRDQIDEQHKLDDLHPEADKIYLEEDFLDLLFSFLIFGTFHSFSTFGGMSHPRAIVLFGRVR